jgi:hypothetical protein
MILSFITKNKYIIIPILINILILLGLLAVVIISGADYHKILLMGDSYYDIAKDFFHGDTLLHKFRGPILPLIYSILLVFPQSIHPFVRLFISMIFSAGTIIILFNITKNYISEKEFLFGCLVFVFNPIYIHWMFRPFPEIYLAFFLGLFILNIVNYYRTDKISFLIYALIAFAISFFIKPVFLFIPILLLLSAVLIKSKKIMAVSLLLLILGIFAYKVQDKITKIEYDSNISHFEKKYEYIHKTLLISESYWVDYVLQTRQFFKPTIQKYKVDYKDGKSLNEYVGDWRENYYQKYPDGNLLFMNLYFIYKEPLLVLQKLLTSPLFFFSMSARPKETFIKLMFSIFSIFLAFLGLKTILKKSKHSKEIILIVSIIIGYISLHMATHAMNRYSLPISPFLYIWGGVPILKFRNRLFGLFRQRTSNITHKYE